MPAIELEEVTMVDLSDEALESVAGLGGTYPPTNFHMYVC